VQGLQRGTLAVARHPNVASRLGIPRYDCRAGRVFAASKMALSLAANSAWSRRRVIGARAFSPHIA